MYCKRCKVSVNCQTDHCPLCHEPIEVDKVIDRAFPVPKVDKRLRTKFSFIYTVLAAVVVIACIIANIFTNPYFMWSVMVLVSLTYIYYLVRFTFISQGHFTARVFGQTVAVTLLLFSVRWIYGGNDWIFITWLPIVYFVSEVLLAVYMLINKKRARKYIISLLALSILGIIPVGVAYILNVSVKWPSIAVTAISIATIITSLIIGRKIIIGELKRYFHL